MEKTLQWEDYLVIVATLCISIGIGIYYRFSGGRQKTMEVCISIIQHILKHYTLIMLSFFFNRSILLQADQ